MSSYTSPFNPFESCCVALINEPHFRVRFEAFEEPAIETDEKTLAKLKHENWLKLIRMKVNKWKEILKLQDELEKINAENERLQRLCRNLKGSSIDWDDLLKEFEKPLHRDYLTDLDLLQLQFGDRPRITSDHHLQADRRPKGRPGELSYGPFIVYNRGDLEYLG